MVVTFICLPFLFAFLSHSKPLLLSTAKTCPFCCPRLHLLHANRHTLMPSQGKGGRSRSVKKGKQRNANKIPYHSRFKDIYSLSYRFMVNMFYFSKKFFSFIVVILPCSLEFFSMSWMFCRLNGGRWLYPNKSRWCRVIHTKPLTSLGPRWGHVEGTLCGVYIWTC